jgi:hypothetical protein
MRKEREKCGKSGNSNRRETDTYVEGMREKIFFEPPSTVQMVWYIPHHCKNSLRATKTNLQQCLKCEVCCWLFTMRVALAILLATKMKVAAICNSILTL